MKHYAKALMLVAAVVFAVPLGSLAASAQECPHSDFKRRPAIVFKPFPLKNPRTGETYLPNQLIDAGSGKMLPAGQVFDEMNTLERNLNEWGYSLREGGEYTLEELIACTQLLEMQGAAIAKGLSESTSWWELDAKLSRMQDSFRAYLERVPSLDRIRRQSDAAAEVFLPPKPAFYTPTTQPKRLQPNNIKKERTWSFETGEKSKFYVGGSFGLSMEAGVTRANASANGVLNGAILGKWDGEVLGATAKGNVNEGSAAGFHVDFRALGKTIFKRDWEQQGIKLDDDWKYEVDPGWDVRFTIGPIPCRARIGFIGSIGVKYGVQVIPIEVGAFVTPYAAAKVYAQVGVDIGIAGAGAGGELLLIQEAFRLTGSAGMSFADELKLQVELTGLNEIEALSGRLYAFAYLDLWFKRWEGRWTLWHWNGFKKSGEAFRFRTSWSPSGVTVDGDATLDDLADIARQRDDIAEANRINARVESEQAVARLDAAEVERMHAVMRGVTDDLNGDAALLLQQDFARLEAADAALRGAVAMYWEEARRWGVSN